MKELYVSAYKRNGQDIVMIYSTAQHLADHAGVPMKPWPYFIGTIDFAALAAEVASTVRQRGWKEQTRSDFDRDHGSKLLPRPA